MSRKELPRAGLLAAAVAGRITNREGAAALRITGRQFQRLKQRFRVGGAPAVRHQGRGRPSPRRLPGAGVEAAEASLNMAVGLTKLTSARPRTVHASRA